MSLYNVLGTSVSGLAAQADRLATGADNIANAETAGYKQASTDFSSLILNNGSGNYQSGSVISTTRYHISEQGNLEFTNSLTDLAVNGEGMFIVASPQGTPHLTRAGSFVPTGNGSLVNAGGFQLLGYPLTGNEPGGVINGFTDLEPVNLSAFDLVATASQSGNLHLNLPSESEVIAAADLPSANTPSAAITGKSSIVAYANLGDEVVLDIFVSKTADNTWEVAVFDESQASQPSDFPYASGPLATETLAFDAVTGRLDAASASSILIPIPNGQPLALDLSQTTQFAADYAVLDGSVDGNAPSTVSGFDISSEGVVNAIYNNGARVATYQIPLGTVPSPDNLNALPLNVFSLSDDSGVLQIGLAEQGSFGSIISGALEQSTVDIATELTKVIEAQRGYTANSRIFQTGSEMLQVLVNLQ